jgi:beta-N-acetylhexosaminidase
MTTSHAADALGQLLLIELEDDVWSAYLERWLLSLRPGGILFSQVRPRTAGGTAELVLRIATTVDFLPFLALEEDGGTASLLHDLFPPLPSPRAAARGGVPTARRLGELVGAGMNHLGFNTNFAPVLDLLTPFSEAILGSRPWGEDPHEVARCADVFVGGLIRHRVLACGKHFPGLGGVRPSTESALPVLGKTMAELWREDLVPYRELRSKLPLVLLSGCAYKAYDLDVLRPAALSPSVLEGLLRVKLGYAGLAVADLRPAPVTAARVDLGDAAVQSMIAGCDILVSTVEGAGQILDGFRRAIELGRLTTQRLGKSMERIRTARRGLARPSGKIRKVVLDQLAKRYERLSKDCQTEEQKIA